MVRCGKLIKRHTSLCPGHLAPHYTPRYAWYYKGKYGRGYTVDKPARTVEEYHYRTYYIFRGEERNIKEVKE